MQKEEKEKGELLVETENVTQGKGYNIGCIVSSMQAGN